MAKKNEPALMDMEVPETEEEIIPAEEALPMEGMPPEEAAQDMLPTDTETPMPDETGNLEKYIDTALAMVDEGIIDRSKASAVAMFLMNREGA